MRQVYARREILSQRVIRTNHAIRMTHFTETEDKVRSSIGKRRVHYNNRRLRMPSKRHKSHRTLKYSRASLKSLGTCSSEQHKVCEEDASQCQKQRSALPRFRSSSFIKSHATDNIRRFQDFYSDQEKYHGSLNTGSSTQDHINGQA